MLIRGPLAIISLLSVLWQVTLQAQTSHTFSAFLIGTAYFNDGRDQPFGDYDVVFQNPNLGASAEFTYRAYGRSRFSVETGLRLTIRSFKTIIYDAFDDTDPGRVGVGRPILLSVPVRIFLGKRDFQRTDENQATGMYAGAMLQLAAQREADISGIQYGIYRQVTPKLLPHILLGVRRIIGPVHVNFEIGLPIQGFDKGFVYRGQQMNYRWWEAYYSIGIGHTL